MKVHVFLRSAGEGSEAKRKREVLDCFYQGLISERVDAVLHDGPHYEPCDVAVVLGGRSRPTTTRVATKAARDHVFSSHRGPFIYLETPLIGRRVYQRSQLVSYLRKRLRLGRKWYTDEYGYYRVGVNGFLQDDGDFNNQGSPPDRWEMLSRTLDLKVKPYRRTGRHVLIVGQSPDDASLRGIDIFDWMFDVAAELRRSTSRPIVVRPHPVTTQPQMRRFEQRFRALDGVVLDYPPRRPIQTLLQESWALLAYSSSATVDALIEGVPCITFNPANMAWPVSDHELRQIEQPTLYERQQWLNDLAYAQWSPEEMRSGAVWRHIRPAVERARAGALAA